MLGSSDKRDYRTIVIAVQMAIQHRSAFDRFNRPRDALDCPALAAFTEVWYTLD